MMRKTPTARPEMVRNICREPDEETRILGEPTGSLHISWRGVGEQGRRHRRSGDSSRRGVGGKLELTEGARLPSRA